MSVRSAFKLSILHGYCSQGAGNMPIFFLRVLYSKCNPVAVTILLHNPSLLIKALGFKALGFIRGSGFRVTGLP